MGFEYATESLNLATIARRGFSSWELEVKGVKGHSSLIFSDQLGAGSIFEISRILNKFYQKVPRGATTLNAAIVSGGNQFDSKMSDEKWSASNKLNIVPSIAYAKGEIRTLSQEDTQTAKQKMRDILNQSLKKTAAKISFKDYYPPMSPTKGNRRLLSILSEVNEDLNWGEVKALEPKKRGAADTSFAAPYVACLDGLGLLGDGAHTENERIKLESIPKVVARNCYFFASPWQRQLF